MGWSKFAVGLHVLGRGNFPRKYPQSYANQRQTLCKQSKPSIKVCIKIAHTACSSFPCSGLSFPFHWECVQSVKTEDDVDVLLAKYILFARQDMLSKRRLHFFSRYSYSTLCRTVTKQDRAARESTTPVISLRLLYLLHKLSTAQIALLDYLLHKSPCWSPAFYEKRVPKIRTVFLQHCEDNHRKAREEFEGVTQFLHCC